jgi:hypothetical protein
MSFASVLVAGNPESVPCWWQATAEHRICRKQILGGLTHAYQIPLDSAGQSGVLTITELIYVSGKLKLQFH